MPAIEIAPEVLLARLQPLVAGWKPGARVTHVEPLLGGTSSLTYAADIAGAEPITRVVVKACPPGLTPTRNRDVLRQARLFNALRGAPGVAVPEVYFMDEGAPVEVPPLFGMTYAAGEGFEPVSKAPDEYRPADVVEARVRAAATMLAALHSVDPNAVGLSAEPVVTLEDEVNRWARALETVEPEFHPESDKLLAKLRARIPEAMAPAILHGDYRLGNIQCDGKEITAIIDWEIWSIGDPRIDVAWFVMFTSTAFWTGANGDAPGMRDHLALQADYEARRGSKLEDMDWFHALIRYKQTAAACLIDKRKRNPGDAPEPGGGKPGLLIRHGLQLIGG